MGEVGVEISVLERRAPLRVVVAGACRRASQSAVGCDCALADARRTPCKAVLPGGNPNRVLRWLYVLSVREAKSQFGTRDRPAE